MKMSKEDREHDLRILLESLKIRHDLHLEREFKLVLNWRPLFLERCLKSVLDTHNGITFKDQIQIAEALEAEANRAVRNSVKKKKIYKLMEDTVEQQIKLIEEAQKKRDRFGIEVLL